MVYTVIMNALVKLLIVAAIFYFGYQQMSNVGGSDLPKSLLGEVRKAKVLDRKLVLLMTGTDWCGACQSMQNGLLSTPEWQRFAANDVIFQKYEYPNGGMASTQIHQDLIAMPGFKGYPTLVVADGSGAVLDMKAGYGGSPQDYISWIQSL